MKDLERPQVRMMELALRGDDCPDMTKRNQTRIILESFEPNEADLLAKE